MTLMAPASPEALCQELRQILAEGRLTPLFQPIATLAPGQVYGYEGLIRGPSASFLHSPINLFRIAERCKLLPELDFACRRAVIEGFVREELPGKLFLNISPACLTLPSFRPGATLEILKKAGLPPQRVVIELTETQPADDYDLLREALLHYRQMGFRIAIDDLGEGFSSLRLWSELQPDFVKIDKYFIQGLDGDAQKRQFVRSIQHIAYNTGTRVIAEGVETRQELDIVRRTGIELVQGYYLAKPQARPPRQLPMLQEENTPPVHTGIDGQCARSLLELADAVIASESNQAIYERFTQNPNLHAIPVIDHEETPVGLLKRHEVLERFARPYTRELYGQRPCSALMDSAPLIVEHTVSLQELSKIMTSCERRYLADGFIMTENGRYLGMGHGHDLMRAITDLQIRAARYANPLTQLPGNVPIQEQIRSLLESRQRFVAVYADLDHFKPYNDVYGYNKGDEAIQMTGELLLEKFDASRDFVGHIGGDDFILLLSSEDWFERCEEVLQAFDRRRLPFFLPEHLHHGGYPAPDRRGEEQWHPLFSLSLGAVEIDPRDYATHHDVAGAASNAKRMAKKQEGSKLFVERRRMARKSMAARRKVA